MRTTLTLACFTLVLPLALRAQTLEHDTEGLVPMSGSIPTYTGANVPPGPAGENVTWDMSALAPGNLYNFEYLTPTGNPEATVRESWMVFEGGIPSQWGAQEYGLTENGLFLYGAGFSESDPMQVMAFPCSYGTIWSGSFPAWWYLGVDGSRMGDLTGKADGYGTLIMPYGDVENVLRVKLTYHYEFNDLSGNIPVTFDVVDYLYYRPGLRVPVLVRQGENSVLPDLGLNLGGGSRWVDTSIALEVNEGAAAEAVPFTLSPNPASKETFVRFDATATTTLEVADALGRTVVSRRINAQGPSFFNERLDVSGLAAGTYIITLRNTDGNSTARRLMVE